MTATRTGWLTVFSLLAVFVLGSHSQAQFTRLKRSLGSAVGETPTQASDAVDENGMKCVIYGLSELGDDPNLAAWIAETMPDVIQPNSWNLAGGAGAVNYYAPAKMMVVYQTPAIHAQVDAFLKNVKKTLPQAKAAPMGMKANPGRSASGIAPATFTAPDAARSLESPQAAKSGYPIPPPQGQPKHLFHFMIRYEGDGAVDSSVTSLARALTGAPAAAEESAEQLKVEPAKAPSLGQLFHIILRYEGDGIIDTNVAEVIKAIQSEKNSSAAPLGCVDCVPNLIVPSSGGTAPMSYPTLAPGLIQPSGSPNGQPGNTVAPAGRSLTSASTYGVPTGQATTGSSTRPPTPSAVPAAPTSSSPYMPPADVKPKLPPQPN